MSKASEWANRLAISKAAIDETKANRPNGFCLHLNAVERLYVNVDDAGSPRLSMSQGDYSIENKQLLELATWILETFGESPSPGPTRANSPEET